MVFNNFFGYSLAGGSVAENNNNDNGGSASPTGSLPQQGLQLWLDATDPSTLTLSGTDVTVWADKSGSGNDATSAPNLNNPQLGNDDLVFDGNSALGYAIPVFAGAATRYIACSIKVSLNINSQYYWSFGGASTNRLFSLATAGNTDRVTILSWGSGNDANSNAGVIQFDTYQIVHVSYDGAVAKVYIDNILVVEFNKIIDTDSSFLSLIGALPGFTNRGLLGSMKEFIVYDRPLSDTERNDLYNFMASKITP